MWDEPVVTESFQSPWEVAESSDGEMGELGFPISFVFFFFRKPKVMTRRRWGLVVGVEKR